LDFLRNKPVIVTIVVAVILVILMAATGPGSAQGATVVGDAFLPMQNFFYSLTEGISGPARQEVDPDLQAQLDEYKLKANGYEELEAENQRLTQILNYTQSHPEQELIVASVTGKDPGNWFEVFTIDRGRADGVEKDMAVITPDGLVGIVEETGQNWARIMSITDARSGVAALVERTRDIGVVKGSVDPNALDAVLSMEYLPLDTDIVAGDTLITSGLDGLYPKGLAIGTVIETTDEAGGRAVRLEPTVDFRRLEEVLVVKLVTEEEGVTNEDISGTRVVPESLPGVTPSSSASPEPADSGDTTGNTSGSTSAGGTNTSTGEGASTPDTQTTAPPEGGGTADDGAGGDSGDTGGGDTAGGADDTGGDTPEGE